MTGALPAVLRTARLVLRPLGPADAGAVIATLGDLGTARWLRPVPHPFGAADFDDFLASAEPGRIWAITEPGPGPGPADDARFCGLVGLAPRLGYWLCPAARGRGLVQEAARAVLAAHFARGATAIESYYMLGNDASAAVLQGLGFVPTEVGTVHARALDADVPAQWMVLSAEDFAAHAP
ncbi:MAG: GNAT family N-acetyltransferase [Sphingomonadales bacterium]|nr:GNAT family N-acetyltransferase [Sphingomonadales bacterium]